MIALIFNHRIGNLADEITSLFFVRENKIKTNY